MVCYFVRLSQCKRFTSSTCRLNLTLHPLANDPVFHQLILYDDWNLQKPHENFIQMLQFFIHIVRPYCLHNLSLIYKLEWQDFQTDTYRCGKSYERGERLHVTNRVCVYALSESSQGEFRMFVT